MSLPLRQLTLYKHGVGFFVRGGAFEGERLALNFKTGDINDILKSLIVLDEAGGQVLGIDYPTPLDAQTRLATSTINLPEEENQGALLQALRGRAVSLEIRAADGTIQTLRGRLVGLDKRGEGAQEVVRVAILLTDAQTVHFFELPQLLSLRLDDPQSAQDLNFFLATRQSQHSTATLEVRLSPGAHQLMISYVAPAPTWRVSYRVLAESTDENGGTLLLQGWGLFDNPLEEDLENVQLTLVAGQPISFIYDLFTHHIPQRPLIKEESRVAPAPPTFKASAPAALGGALGRIPSRARMTEAEQAPPLEMAAARFETEKTVQTQEGGALFQYHILTPVSVKRGGSALVPLLSFQLPYRRELLYNEDKLPRHPVASLRFTNATDLTLERGPLTLIEDGSYKGEAILSFCPPGALSYLPYAVELGLTIKRSTQHARAIYGVRLEGRGLIYQKHEMRHDTYHIENNTAKPQTLTLEEKRQAEEELYSTPDPISLDPTFWRWQVEVPAHTTQTFISQKRRKVEEELAWENVTPDHLETLLKGGWLDESSLNRLQDYFKVRQEGSHLEKQENNLKDRQKTLLQAQQELRENLKALQADMASPDMRVRQRVLEKLEANQDILDKLEGQAETLRQQREALQKALDDELAKLGL
jgi:hypothetical protein